MSESKPTLIAMGCAMTAGVAVAALIPVAWMWMLHGWLDVNVYLSTWILATLYGLGYVAKRLEKKSP